MSKYNAKKITVDGIEFDSEMESRYYFYLKHQKMNLEIHDFQLQPRFELLSAFEKMGKKLKAIEYVADFLVIHLDGTSEVVDVKGFVTESFAIKKKMFDFYYPIYKLTLITESPKKYGGGWIELDELKKLRKKSKAELAKKLAAESKEGDE